MCALALDPDLVSHEFGHLVEFANRFAYEGGGDHTELVNFRDFSSSAIQTPSQTNLDGAFCEGYADYFAVAAKDSPQNPSTLNIRALAGGTRYKGFDLLRGQSGHGEDEEISVAEMLFRLDRQGINRNGWNTELARVQAYGPQGIFDVLIDSEPLDLAQFYNAIAANGEGNQYLATIGSLSQSVGVSAYAQQPYLAGTTFNFQVPKVFGLGSGGSPQGLPMSTFTSIQIQVEVFDSDWSPVCICGFGPDDPENDYFDCSISVDGTIGKGTLVLTPEALSQIFVGHGIYWVVEAKSYETSVGSPYYWSGPVKLPEPLIPAFGVPVNVFTNTTNAYAVATIAGLSSIQAANLIATVAWSGGDGTETQANGGITFSNSGGTTVATVYCTGVSAPPGTYAQRTTFYANSGDYVDGDELAMVDSTVTVTDGNDLTSSMISFPYSLQFATNYRYNASIADVTIPATARLAAATINWGDGSQPMPALIVGNSNPFIIAEWDMHVYTAPGSYTLTVTIYDGWGAQASARLQNVHAGPDVTPSSAAIAASALGSSTLNLTPLSGINVTNNCGYEGQLATFSESDQSNRQYDPGFEPYFFWTTADGSTCAQDNQQIAASSGNVSTISGPWWDFAGTGTKNITVELFQDNGNEQTVTVPITVNPGALHVSPVAQLPIDDLNSGDPVLVARFTDTDPAAVSANFAASLTWGMSSCICTVVPADDDYFDVYASTSTPFVASSAPITVTVKDTKDSNGPSATVTDNTLVLDSGSTVTLAALPSGSNVTITNGTTLDLDGNSVALGAVGVNGGSIVDGSVSASAFTLDNSDVSANLSGGSLTAGGLVSLCGTDSLTGTVTVNTPNDELDVSGALSTAGGLTDNGAIVVENGGSLANLSGGSIDVSGGSTITLDAGSSLVSYGTATNEGTISVASGGVMVNTDTGSLTSAGEIDDAGTIVNANGAVLDLAGGGLAVNGDGVVACDGASTIQNSENISFNGTSGAVITGPDTLTDDSGNLILVNDDSYALGADSTYPNLIVTGGSNLDLAGYVLTASGNIDAFSSYLIDTAGGGSAIANAVIMNNAIASGSGTSITGASLILTNSTINCEVFGGNSSVDGTTTLVDTTGSTIISNVTGVQSHFAAMTASIAINQKTGRKLRGCSDGV